jgi:hypothetical protein
MPGILLGAEALALIMDSPAREAGSATISLKTYGYLRSGRPIVYIGPEGAQWDLVRQFAGTYRYDFGAWDQIAAHLMHLCRQREDWTQARLDHIRQYSWRALTEKLARVFDTVAEPARRVAVEA